MPKKLTLSRSEVGIFCRDNLYATLMLQSAEDDYVAARCLILNFLLRGLGLASEAIEKALKAILFLETGSKRKGWHKPYELKEELKKHKKDWSRLDKFDDLLKRLYSHYQYRYHDNPDKSTRQSSQELSEIDELWFYLWDNLPLPDEVKYRLAFYAWIFEEEFNTDDPKMLVNDSRNKFIITRNVAFNNRHDALKKRYSEVRKHLYPDI